MDLLNQARRFYYSVLTSDYKEPYQSHISSMGSTRFIERYAKLFWIKT